MDDYQSRVNRIRTMIKACLLDSHEEDEDFFSASDGSESPPPPSCGDHRAEKDGSSLAAGGAAVCTSFAGTASDAIADNGRGEAEAGCSPLFARDERGPTRQTEPRTRLVSVSDSKLAAGGPPQNGSAKERVTCSRRETIVEAELAPCTVGQSNARNTSDESAAAQTLTAATSHESCNVVSFAGISVSGLRLLMEVSHSSLSSLKVVWHARNVHQN